MYHRQAFGFITGCDTQVPVDAIRACAAHFVPQARADFKRVQTVQDFCQFFLERSKLCYRRFQFRVYVQHELAYGFVLILTGQRDKGLERIQEFCQGVGVAFDNKILAEYIRCAESRDMMA